MTTLEELRDSARAAYYQVDPRAAGIRPSVMWDFNIEDSARAYERWQALEEALTVATHAERK